MISFFHVLNADEQSYDETVRNRVGPALQDEI